MNIRRSQMSDLLQIKQLYADARHFMAEHGNPRQWGDRWPPDDLVEEDVQEGRSYVCVGDNQAGDHKGERVIGVFVFIQGPDPTYKTIKNGAWISDEPYWVVHRIATAPSTRGVGTFCLTWAFEQSGHLRIDTHPDNLPMQGLLNKLGFTYCGIINVEEDNDPRYAYEKLL